MTGSPPGEDPPEEVPVFGRPSGELPAEFVAELQAAAARRLMEAAAAGQNPEHFTPLDTHCLALHTWFTSLIRAGFSENQALTYLAHLAHKP